jgi:hypothetical protein
MRAYGSQALTCISVGIVASHCCLNMQLYTVQCPSFLPHESVTEECANTPGDPGARLTRVDEGLTRV